MVAERESCCGCRSTQGIDYRIMRFMWLVGSDMARLSFARCALLTVAMMLAVCACHSGAATGTATLSWQVPTTNTDGSPIGTITGYDIYYGTSPSAMTQTIHLTNPNDTVYVVQHLRPGTYYFSVATTTASGTSAHTPPMST